MNPEKPFVIDDAMKSSETPLSPTEEAWLLQVRLTEEVLALT